MTLTPPAGTSAFFQASNGSAGVESLAIDAGTGTQRTVTVGYRSPGSLENGVYNDTITLSHCRDSACAEHLPGSPLTISSAYEVHGTGTSTATINRTAIDTTSDTRDELQRTENVAVTISPAPAVAVAHVVNHSTNAIAGATMIPVSGGFTLALQILPGADFDSDLYEDTVTLRLCYDASCVREVSGSPFTIALSLDVRLPADPVLTPLPTLSRVELPHDIVAAAYSRPLNRVVMASAHPVNALYVYDPITEVEQSIPLSKAPAALAIAPDGMAAAVGHDALVSLVDLTTVAQPTPPVPQLLDVSADVAGVVLDGRGVVHVVPAGINWVTMHSVDSATNTEQLSAHVSFGPRARLHPGGDFIYLANNGVSPDDLEKVDIRSGTASYLHDSPYHAEHAMCGDLWFDEPGTRIFTACGNTFWSSMEQSMDLLYAGRVGMSTDDWINYRIVSLDHSDIRNEIALLESTEFECARAPQTVPCFHHLVLLEEQFLAQQAIHALGTVEVGGISRVQRGLHVFYNSTGMSKILLSRVEGLQDPARGYYLSVLQ